MRFCLLFLLPGLLLAAKPSTALGTYTGAIVVDAASGQVLFEDHADVVNPPASMTKLMTFAVLHDKLASGAISLTTPVRVTSEDSSMGGTQVYLDPRETFPVEELIYAMMIQSANDAAHALARAAAGSSEAFVELMNAKARELGMTHTTFRSPHGLPPKTRRVADGDLTTPRDFAILCRHLLEHTDVLKYSSVKQRAFGTGVRAKPQEMINHNKLLGKIAGVDGLKTGYTESAGYCISVSAERNGRHIIVVVMGAFGHNRTIDKGQARDLKSIELLERGFASLPAQAP
jgi:D-alanyl-D-alanine carboxypeptidase (penicillin-binding protein 5/6)